MISIDNDEDLIARAKAKLAARFIRAIRSVPCIF